MVDFHQYKRDGFVRCRFVYSSKMKFHEAVLVISAVGLVVSSDVAPPSLSESDLMRSLEAGHQYTERLAELEKELIADNIFTDESSSAYRLGHSKRASPEAIRVGRQALQLLEATRVLKEKGLISNESISLRQGNLGPQTVSCLPRPSCNLFSKYRTIDGSCNSLRFPLLGKSSTTYRRVLPANYADGIELPRLASDNTVLKSPRLISSTVIGPTDRPSGVTLAVVQFGQFLDHDLALTPKRVADGPNTCCRNGRFLPPRPFCIPIRISVNDPFYSQVNGGTCMSFVRSMLGVRNDCSLGPADQINANTHWLDGSAIYGSFQERTNTLRSFVSGRLVASNFANRQLLPVGGGCSDNSCFRAGDGRVTEQPNLAVMHTIWLREHNRIADGLANLNPTWSDETLFQEARRIVIAELQHITYTQWLPTLLSPSYLESNGLLPSADFSTYKQPTTNMGPISNEFTTAAMRMGHSMVQGFVRIFDQFGVQTSQSHNLSDVFNDASLLVRETSYLDSAIRGMLTQRANTIDSNVNRQLTNFLFKGNSDFGQDLVSLNIQRGRDHGLPSYNNYRRFCGLNPIKSFDEYPFPLSSTMAQSYNSVEDIDLFIGGLTESPVPGGRLGPTFSCLFADTFSHLKFNDRFFYEVGGRTNSFTLGQLNEIRKTTMARILCDNSDGTLFTVNSQAFLQVSITNPKVTCDSLPRLNLELWRNERL